MGTNAVRCLSNSISRFIHLVSCRTLKNMPYQKDYKDVANLLKLLKPVLDKFADAKVLSDKILSEEEYEELDLTVNEAREFIENWSPSLSKICGAVQSRRLILNIQGHSLKICITVCRSSSSSSTPSSTSTIAEIQHCMKEFQNLKLEKASERLEEALKCLRGGLIPSSEHLIEVMELLNLTSSRELLKESIAVEKEKMKVNVGEIIDLISCLRENMVKLESFKVINGIPIPSYFRCPLSLQLMSDPVIVASGQTYERDSIQKWIDQGLTICPITRQILTHTNLIPNYTVKALIENWCDENKIRLTITSIPSKPKDLSSQDPVHMDSSNSSLHSSNSTSGSSIEVRNGYETQNSEKLEHSSPEQSCSHSRSESTSTAVSSYDYLPVSSDGSKLSSKHGNQSELSGEMTSQYPNPASGFSPWLSGKQYHSSNQMDEMLGNGNHNYTRTLSLPSESSCNDLTSTAHVEKLVKDLQSSLNDVQTKASTELRFLAKHNMENRVIIGRSGAIEPLLSLLHSNVKMTQEHAVTALLNLSINGNIKSMIAEAGAIEPLIHVLKTGNSGAKENAAAALFSLSVLEEYRVKIGRSGAVKALVDLLGSGTLRGKKDAATALFNLSIFHENKARIIQAGAVKYLVELLDPTAEMVEKAVALLANLSTISEGCLAIAREGGIPLLVEVVETGAQRGKENAASILLQLCLSSPKYCRLVLQEGAVPPLVALSQSGTPRAKEKAQQLLSHFRSQREGSTGRGKS